MAEPKGGRSKASSISVAFKAGLVSGGITTALFQPFELVKTRMQRTRGVSDGRVSMVRITRSVIANEGFVGLWNGLTPALARAIPGVGLYFALMQGMKTAITNDVRAMTSMEAAFVGGAARITAGAILMPMTVLKTRYESGLFKYAGLLEALRTIVRQEGFVKLFSGMVPSIIRDLPFSSAYLGFYTHAQKWLTADLFGVSSNVISLTLIHASYAGTMASILTHPPDVVRTRMQLHAKAEPMKLIPAINSVYYDFGAMGFFRGLLPRLLRRTLVSCVSWTMYEASMKKAS